MHTYATCIRITHQACHMNIYINIYMHGMHEEFSCSLSSFHKDLFLKYIPPSIWAADLPPDLALPDLYLGWLLGWKDMASLNQTTDFQGSPPHKQAHIISTYLTLLFFFFGGGGAEFLTGFQATTKNGWGEGLWYAELDVSKLGKYLGCSVLTMHRRVWEFRGYSDTDAPFFAGNSKKT